MKESSVWTWSPRSPTANIFGCEPCPECNSDFRYVLFMDPENIVCNECGLVQRKTGDQWAEWKKVRGIK